MSRSLLPRIVYLTAAVVLFAIEVLIALYVHDGLVRAYLGDVLAIALVYAMLRAATPLSVPHALALTLAIALAIEITQALNVLASLGLADNQLARTVFGGVFDWSDLAAYAAGAFIIAGFEVLLTRRTAE